MPWYASKRQTVSRNGKNVWVEKDEHVPEADGWEDVWKQTEEFVYWRDDAPVSNLAPVVENIRPVEEKVIVAKPEPALDDEMPKKKRSAPKRKAPTRKSRSR